MFIKKDLRKIPRILADAATSTVQEPPCCDGDQKHSSSEEEPASKRLKRELLTELHLSRRQAEFNGSLSILCQPKNAPSLYHLISLSLYDCKIRSLDGIGMLASPAVDDDNDMRVDCCCPNLSVLNVGRNPITTLPDELALLSNSLKELWCDDCHIAGAMPDCILQLFNLETLRLSNNQITSIPIELGENLQQLRTLCLDRNEISTIPPELSQLSKLKSLMLRHNKIEELPEGVPGGTMLDLTLLHVSSNQLTRLPYSLVECTSLEALYINSNKIERIPMGLGQRLTKLTRLNASHNKLERLSSDFVNRFGEPTANGRCEKDSSCVVLVGQNPVVDQIAASAMEEEEGLNGASVRGLQPISAT